MNESFDRLANHTNTIAYYSNFFDQYFYSTYNIELCRTWQKALKYLKKEYTILDLGSGSGRDTHYFSLMGYNAIGIDISIPLSKLSSSFFDNINIVADAYNIPLGDLCMDFIWSIGTLIHIPRHMISNILIEIYRTMKNDSLIFTAIKSGSGEYIDTLGRYNVLYTLDEWRELLELNKFLVLDIEEVVSSDNNNVIWIECLSKKI